MYTHPNPGQTDEERPHAEHDAQPERSGTKGDDGQHGSTGGVAGGEGVRIGVAIDRAPVAFRAAPADGELDGKHNQGQTNCAAGHQRGQVVPHATRDQPDQKQPQEHEPGISRVREEGCRGFEPGLRLGQTQLCGGRFIPLKDLFYPHAANSTACQRHGNKQIGDHVSDSLYTWVRLNPFLIEWKGNPLLLFISKILVKNEFVN